MRKSDKVPRKSSKVSVEQDRYTTADEYFQEDSIVEEEEEVDSDVSDGDPGEFRTWLPVLLCLLSVLTREGFYSSVSTSLLPALP